MTREESQKCSVPGPKSKDHHLTSQEKERAWKRKGKTKRTGGQSGCEKGGARHSQAPRHPEGGGACARLSGGRWRTAGQLGGGWMVRSFLPSRNSARPVNEIVIGIGEQRRYNARTSTGTYLLVAMAALPSFTFTFPFDSVTECCRQQLFYFLCLLLSTAHCKRCRYFVKTTLMQVKTKKLLGEETIAQIIEHPKPKAKAKKQITQKSIKLESGFFCSIPKPPHGYDRPLRKLSFITITDTLSLFAVSLPVIHYNSPEATKENMSLSGGGMHPRNSFTQVHVLVAGLVSRNVAGSSHSSHPSHPSDSGTKTEH